jgi:hypothetical protein
MLLLRFGYAHLLVYNDTKSNSYKARAEDVSPLNLDRSKNQAIVFATCKAKE